MNKKQQLLDYLDDQIFIPISTLPNVPPQLKFDFEQTRQYLKQFCASGILYYVWNDKINHGPLDCLSIYLKDEGYNDFTTTIDNFQHEFTYEWLMS